MNQDLLNPKQRIDLPGACMDYWPRAISPAQADAWLAALEQQLAFRSERLRLFGRDVTVPRLVAWYGDAGAQYRYSGRDHSPLPWTDTLAAIRQWMQRLTEAPFNSVLANLYRDGSDHMGWHADDEAELGPAPVIASLSLGVQRRFGLRSRARPRRFLRLDLAHGSVLVMRGATQQHWQHCLYRSRTAEDCRINLTFRQVLAPDVAGRPARYNQAIAKGKP